MVKQHFLFFQTFLQIKSCAYYQDARDHDGPEVLSDYMARQTELCWFEFLAPTGAQGVPMSVCLSVCP